MEKGFNEGNNCLMCRNQILTGSDGDVLGCRRHDEGMSCKFEQRGMTLSEILADIPQDEIIGDNIIRAYSKINSPIYKKIICTVSGGYDSDIVIDICTKCDKEKKIEYVWFNTGLEYQATKDHLKELEHRYGIEIEERKPKKPIPVACKENGLPFLSKKVSEFIGRLQRYRFKWEDRPFDELYKEYPKCKAALRWWCNKWGEGSQFNISRNKYLKEYMIDNPPIDVRFSADCCKFGKKDVLHEELRSGEYDLNINGMRKFEGGARGTIYNSCFKENEGGCDMYMPVWWYLDSTKEVYRNHYKIERSLCYEEYGLRRTGCAGCPYGRNFEEELEIIEKYEPNLFKAVNNIFGKSYSYTRNYRRYATFMKAFEKEADHREEEHS